MSTIKSEKTALDVRLGSDLKFPIDGSFVPIKGIDLLLQDIQQLLLTVPGERVNRPNFGCNLRNQIWENIDTAATEGEASIAAALENFEPRITLIDVESEIERNNGIINFTIRFYIKENDQPINLVFPFRSGTSLSFQ